MRWLQLPDDLVQHPRAAREALEAFAIPPIRPFRGVEQKIAK
jgi:hypothetical protein